MPTDRDAMPNEALAGAIVGPYFIASGMLPSGRTERRVSLRVGRRWTAVDAQLSIAPTVGVPGLIVAVLPPGIVDGVESLRFGGRDARPVVLGTIADVLRAGLSSAPVEDRHHALAFLVAACGEVNVLGADVSDALVSARAILREVQPAAIVDAALPPTARVDVMLRIDARTVYVQGWIGCPPGEMTRATLYAPEGAAVDLPPTMFRHHRPDVGSFYGRSDPDDSAEMGFACTCTLDTPSARTDGWLLEIETAGGVTMEAACPPLTAPLLEVRDRLIAQLALERPPGQALRVHHLAPAIAQVQSQLGERVRIARVEAFGTPAPSPELSIVVPLYRRTDFLRHQLAQFVHDPEVLAADLLYVLDSPGQERELLAEAERLSRLYRVPFRIAVLSANGGFSLANNLGASLARGRLLLLMNSDVLPDRPGWASRLARAHDALDAPGAVGPKLVYEDESIQHAGLWFDKPSGGRLWFNEHHYKGLHRSFPAACVPRKVPAVSAACLLIDRERYLDMGGLRGGFVQGDFEDSDLCLRLHEAGRQIWYAADVELYHLEGQSYPSDQRIANGEFNRWLHTHLWDHRIEAVMAADTEDRRAPMAVEAATTSTGVAR